MKASEMEIGFLGTHYKASSFTILEAMAFSREAIQSFYEHLPRPWLVDGMVIVSTCNRVEFYFSASDLTAASKWLKGHIAAFKKLDKGYLDSVFEQRFGFSVIEHLFRVVSGLNSMVFGENEILRQIKEAYYLSNTLGATDSVLNKTFQVAVAVGKRIRKDTYIGQGAYSLTSIAIDGVQNHFPDFIYHPLLVVGAGTMGMRILRKLLSLGHQDVFITNRTEDKCEKISQRYPVCVLPYGEVLKRVGSFPVLVTAIQSDQYFLREKDFQNGHKTRLIVDLGIPRNVNPDVQRRSIQLLTMDNLKSIAENTIFNRMNDITKVEAIFKEEMNRFFHWYRVKTQICFPKFA